MDSRNRAAKLESSLFMRFLLTAGVPQQPKNSITRSLCTASEIAFDPFVRQTARSIMSKRFYITTAIDYVNGQPHLGHAYEKIVADVIARSRRSLGQEVYFLTGLDEHGQKVQQAAIAEGKTPQAYCDEIAATWQVFIGKLGITNDDFAPPPHPRHKEVVQAIVSKLHAAGQFSRATH